MTATRLLASLAAVLAGALGAGAAAAEGVPASPSASIEIEGAHFNAAHEIDDVALELHAVGLLRWLIFNGYAAALYLGEEVAPRLGGEVAPSEVLADVPKRLELHYFRSIPAVAVAGAAQQILERSFDPKTLAPLQTRIDRIGALYVDISPGDRYALSYLPGTGTLLDFNGRRMGVIPGADFAQVYFAIWLGTDPIDATLRDQLLSAR